VPLKELFYKVAYMAGRVIPLNGVTILSYHSIDDNATPLSVSPGLFALQMAVLARENCTTLTMSEVASCLSTRTPFPKRAVAITFDDGFENVLINALPILTTHNLKSTVYIITGMAGRTTAWTDLGTPLPPLRVLDYPQIEQLYRAGVEIGAHSITHGFMTQYSATQLHDELLQPKQQLETLLNTPVTSFAYPQGDYNPRVLAAVKHAGYTTATTVDQGRATPRSNPLALPRLLVSNNSTPDIIRSFTSPAMIPAYHLINFVIHHIKRNPKWPRRNPGEIDSTQSTP
jgi:peptidoglycan/xylan/chitin deacetylase (PgdA/CDA1 family)